MHNLWPVHFFRESRDSRECWTQVSERPRIVSKRTYRNLSMWFGIIS
jgi:hypothetical protein